MFRKIIKRLICRHDWERMWLESAYWSGEEGTNPLSTWMCKCKKCDKHKFICFEDTESGEKEVK